MFYFYIITHIFIHSRNTQIRQQEKDFLREEAPLATECPKKETITHRNVASRGIRRRRRRLQRTERAREGGIRARIASYSSSSFACCLFLRINQSLLLLLLLLRQSFPHLSLSLAFSAVWPCCSAHLILALPLAAVERRCGTLGCLPLRI